MKRLLLLFVAVFAYAFDTDLDGVADRKDRCPNTPFWETVGSDGCPVGRLLPLEFEAKYGQTYVRLEGVEARRYFLDTRIYYKTYALIAYFSKMSVEGSRPKSLDAVLSLADTVYEDRTVKSKLYATLYLPTHYKKNTDYGLKASCYLKEYDLMFSYRYRRMRDYHDTHTFLGEYYIRRGTSYLAPFLYVESASADSALWSLFGGAILHFERERAYFDIEAMRIYNEDFGNGYSLTLSVGLRF